jgi:lipoprotein-anchoring transpeptidase ErfK/SrfK
VLESNFVSGNLSENALTNVGVGSILSKEQHATLKGEDFDGVSKYETPVDYWMPIGWDGEGFHDAPWRGAFGGAIYQTYGSHGCINMPPAAAKKLFDEVDFLTPVVVYESSTSFSPPMSY